MAYYFDYMASTPICGVALEAYQYAATTCTGNSSGIHAEARKAGELIGQAEDLIFEGLHIVPEDRRTIYDIAWRGSASAATRDVLSENYMHLSACLCSAAEHKSVLTSLPIDLPHIRLPIDEHGQVQADKVEALLREHALSNSNILLSVMHVNNELGTINMIQSIGHIVSKFPRVIYHVDSCQSFGKLYIDMPRFNIDLLTISGHKVHGPKGIGAIVFRKRSSIELNQLPKFVGTANTAAIYSMGKAFVWTEEKYGELFDQYTDLYQRRELFSEILATQTKRTIYRNYARGNSVPWCINVHIPGINGTDLVLACEDVCFSTGSSCNSTAEKPSHVLMACGYDVLYARNSIRFSFDPITTTDKDIEEAATYIASRIKELG